MAEKRRFSSIEAMDNELVKTWNAWAAPEDKVYIVGDIIGTKHLYNLNGRLYLIQGNHDEKSNGKLKLNQYIQARFEWIKPAATIAIPDQDAPSRHRDKAGAPVQYIYLHHYACLVWKYSHYGSFHLFGHSHGNLPDNPHSKSIDVSMDAVAKRYTNGVYRPISYEEVKAIMAKKTFKPVDHHGASR